MLEKLSKDIKNMKNRKKMKKTMIFNDQLLQL